MSGAVVGLGASLYLHLTRAHAAELTGFTTGTALLCDLDCVGSCAARSLGFLSYAVAWVIRLVSGGHRHLTHAILGIAGFTALAALACRFRHDDYGRAGLALLITLTVSAGLEALHVSRWLPRSLRGGHVEDVAGIVVAAAVVWRGYGLALIPLAVALGCAVHICGDMLTDSGCMLGFPLSQHRFHLLPSLLTFTTGTDPELYVVDPMLGAAFVVLAAFLLDPGLSMMLWTRLIQTA